MGSAVPKQFLELCGKPVLVHTLELFERHSGIDGIYLVVSADYMEKSKELVRQYGIAKVRGITAGGGSVQESIYNGLRYAVERESADAIVLLHDGVRPFPSIDVIRNCYETARTKKAVIPVIPVVETVRQLKSEGSITVPRDQYRLVQTPQTFDIQLLKAANRQPYNDGFTDDASVVESYGHAITLVEGNRENIKITTPYDIIVAEALCKP